MICSRCATCFVNFAVLITLASSQSGCQPGSKETGSSKQEGVPTKQRGFAGSLDGFADNNIFGWAMSETDFKRAVSVDIYDEVTLLGTAKADKPRKDLLGKKIGTGNYGFSFSAPKSLHDGKVHNIRAKVRDTDFELQNSPQGLTIPEWK